MGTIDQRLVGPGKDFLQGRPHLLGSAFKQPSAAKREKGISHKADTGLRAVVNNVATGMSGRVVNRESPCAERHRIAFPNHTVDPGDAVCIRGRADDLASGL